MAGHYTVGILKVSCVTVSLGGAVFRRGILEFALGFLKQPNRRISINGWQAFFEQARTCPGPN
jgi:hypothetical protein